MSFTTTIKEEIVKIPSSKSELIAELSAYIRNNSDFSKEDITMTTENKFLIDHIQESMETIYNITGKIDIIENLNFSKKELYQLTILKKDQTILKDLGILDDQNSYLENVPNS